jgi:hypothetical protein
LLATHVSHAAKSRITVKKDIEHANSEKPTYMETGLRNPASIREFSGLNAGFVNRRRRVLTLGRSRRPSLTNSSMPPRSIQLVPSSLSWPVCLELKVFATAEC